MGGVPGCAVSSRSDRCIDGGVWPAPPQAHKFVQLHVQVERVDDSVQRATKLGASVLVPAQDLPEGQRMAVLRDPEGVPFVVMQPTARG
ncbi:hypothetical protein AY599_01960 [Leptolyngbya valderiana BDU 20041]|nr:hypothetical protein AY599_01960 [Leptolyngbya valderiana BDU 20041]